MRRPTTQKEVLRAVSARLLQKVDSLNPTVCIVSVEPDPPKFPSHKNFVTVSPCDGSFDEAWLEGGGIAQCAEMAGVCVTMFYRSQLDQNNHGESAIEDDRIGLLEQKHQILKALTDHDLSVGADQILNEPMKPRNSVATKRTRTDDRLVYSQLYFSTDFLWDLTGA